MNNVQFHIGEVVANNTTYDYSVEKNFEIRVITYTDFYNRLEILAIPYDNNIKKIPAVGEHVLLICGLSQENTKDSIYPQWYYASSFSVNSDVNDNKLSEYVTSDSEITGSINLTSKQVSWLQPFSGDVMLEGRYGQSIRFSSTTKQQYSNLPTWTGQQEGDPIILLSNGRKFENNYVVENLHEDASSLYLTSTQKIPILLGDKNNRNPLSCYAPMESSYERSQFIGVADRIILKAKTDIAVIDSPRGIVLNTTGEVKIGNDEANVSLVHGDILLNILQKILNQLSQPIQCGSAQGTFINRTNLSAAQNEIQNLLNSKYFITKDTY